MVRKVYLDFSDGNGYRDVSSLVKYDSLSITMRSFSDTFHYAQNEATFTLLFDVTIFNLFKAATVNVLCRIVDVYDDAYLTAENGAYLLTEAGLYLMRETGGAIPLFYGIIPATSSYKYNGILDNTMFTCHATDSIQLLDKKVGDICYRNYTIMNPASPTTSIVHQLAYIAGFTSAQIDSSITIPTVVQAVSPPSEDESVLTMLDNILFEYGYALNMNEADQISPIQWNNTTSGYVHQFDDTNIVKEIERTEKEIEYEGVEVTYNELADRSNVLLYREDIPYNSSGGFAGVALLSGYMYPAEANVIDDTTGKNQVVDYVYTDESIKYFTNKAVTKGIQDQWNYKAFSSDFSAIVATSGHYLNWNADRKGTDVNVVTSGYDVVIDGVNVPTYYFGNKKARVILKNNGAAAFLYYMNINGDVLYRTADRKMLVQNVASTTKVEKYTANFLYNSTDVSALATGLAKNHQVGNVDYTFSSEDAVDVGSVVRVYMDDGTDTTAMVMQREYDESKPTLYDYELKSCSSDRGSLTQKRISRYSNSTKQVYLYKGDTLIVAASGYGGYDSHYQCKGANDNVEIQAAIDYVYNTFGGGTVQKTAGTYIYNAAITMRPGVRVVGVGPGTIDKPASASVTTMYDFTTVSGASLENLAINGNMGVYNDINIDVLKGNLSCKATNVSIYGYALGNMTVSSRELRTFVSLQVDNCISYRNTISTHPSYGEIHLFAFKSCSPVKGCQVIENTANYHRILLIGFDACSEITGCLVDNNTISGGTNSYFSAFSNCTNLSACTASNNTITSGIMWVFSYATNISSCTSNYNHSPLSSLSSFINCNRCAVCSTHDNTAYALEGFRQCYGVQQCASYGDTSPYYLAYASPVASGIYVCAPTAEGGFNYSA